jgi:hypothetical protein
MLPCIPLFLSVLVAPPAPGPAPTHLEPPPFARESLSAPEFTRLHAAIAPHGERWTEIPWETDLGAARQRSARDGKPLLMWVMDGHPLGCT